MRYFHKDIEIFEDNKEKVQISKNIFEKTGNFVMKAPIFTVLLFLRFKYFL